MERFEVIIGGFGGQGTLLAGTVLGRAAVYDGKKVTQVRSYGAEARGGAARSEVVISKEEIDYPLVIEADVLIATSQPALDKYLRRVKRGGLVIIDEDLVGEVGREDVRVVRVSAVKIATKELGLPVAANMIMMGVLIALTEAVGLDSIKRSIKASVPKGTEELNLRALERGLMLGERIKRELGESSTRIG